MVGPFALAAIHCGTCFSRESVGCYAAKLMVLTRASSRLKPVPLIDLMHSVRLVWPNCRIACSHRDWLLLNGGTVRSHRDWLRFIVGPALAGKASIVTPRN
jgi:hypothetical protein